jgi:ribosome-associated translation inhibitor RaiA
MRIKVTSPGMDIKQSEIDRIEKDLEKIGRRLSTYKDVEVLVRAKDHNSSAHPKVHVTMEIDYGRTHLVAKGDDDDIFVAVRQAREDVLRQINDRSRGGHSSFAKGT